MSSFENILYAVDSGIATITLNRPDRMNAMTFTMAEELIAAFDLVDADDAVRAVVVTGAGRAFCAGADLQGGGTFGKRHHSDTLIRPDGSIAYETEEARDRGGKLALRIFGCLKPVIGAINGVAVGIGATMALPMDIRLASDGARFGFVFVRRGIVPEAASSFFLPRVVGISQALEWTMSGRVFPAQEALEGGLVKRLLPEADLLAAAYDLGKEIADNAAPVSVALARQMMWRGLTMQHPMEAHRLDSRGVLARSRSADAAEGVASFLDKRPANYPDRVSRDMPDYFPWYTDPAY
ncbi:MULTISPECIES: crotonase/enoyl-CoA hydratase family protein [unclassified Sphingomonas]|uniref:crotonase/enoyl-CoA hydratase family protein n=1 Tax=unclassified Sphingomonas TaxID=196159 RepID=UPI0006F497FA|nr:MULTISPECIES: crotonase/enoyl-CoA hydratase family protein [unclassified Sphingomonas]KQX18601.1 enoyl-CoA hydratase [Sphingomonas sp. Root1294]KQY72076.1 enoyl-CoA hydratase [Sphingomonas sp. Root50]KRB94655.1 enoyl-CoA hydratase [Sphingomonas sp. Root720]